MSLLLAMLLVSGQAPSTQQAAAAAPVPAAVAKPAKPKLICKADDGDTGSHIVKRTCLTQDQWNARVQGRSLDEFNSTAQVAH